MNQLKIEYLKIEDLNPYKNNTRKHASKDIEQIVKSIKKYGFDDPIGIWSDKNIIVEGHGRLMAAKKLGMKEVPCIRLDHLSDEQRREYGIAHNATAELSEWFDEKLKEELNDLDMSDFEFDFPSFDESKEDAEIKTVEIRPYRKVHYLISLDINDNDKVIDIITKLKDMDGIEVENTLN